MMMVRLWGGLGNQMFQYAFGYAMAEKNHTSLALDTRFFSEEYLNRNPHFSRQKPNLLRLPIDYRETVNAHGEMKLVDFLQKRNVNRLIRVPRYCAIPMGGGMKYVKEARLEYLPKVAALRGDSVYFDGYWQTEQYFADYREELLRQFCLPSEAADRYAEQYHLSDADSVAVHMRMGDYAAKKHLTAHYNYVINPAYYRNAIEEIRHRVHGARFFICSNSIAKAKAVLGDDPAFTYVNEDRQMTDWDEFMIMSHCTHHIISNSTFSWWAAWLAQDNPSAVNIGPDMVFGNKDILPKSWLRVNVPE